MKNDTVHAITLGVIKYGDTSLISACYTLEHGLQSYILKGVLSKGSKKISKSLFEPLNLLELQASKNPNNRLGYIKEAKLYSIYKSIPFDLGKKSLLFFLAEVLHQVFREEQASNPPLYHFIEKNLLWLDTQNDLGLFHIKMMLDLTKFIGFYPNTNNKEAPYFDLGSGCMSFVKPKAPFLKDPLKRYLTQILGTAFDKIGDIKLLKQEKMELLSQVITYFELHLQQFKPPKSTVILNEIFKTH
tara:strand:- start:520 stop:1251 length:732 start_codon:yes stop_codon:yes gene_type:complete